MLLPFHSHDTGAFRELETSKGGVMVSTDLLTPSSNKSDEDSGIPSYSSESIDEITPPSSNTSAIIPTCHICRLDDTPLNTQVGRAAHIEALPFDSTSPLQHMWQEDHRLDASEQLNYVMPPQIIATAQTFGVPDQEPLGPGILPLYVNPCETLSTPSPQEHSIPTEVAYGDNSTSDNHSPGGSDQIIPSYMSPEAIRARNIILSCNLPAKQNRYTAWDQPLTHQKAHIDDLHPPKRQKLEGQCCNPCPQAEMWPSR